MKESFLDLLLTDSDTGHSILTSTTSSASRKGDNNYDWYSTLPRFLIQTKRNQYSGLVEVSLVRHYYVTMSLLIFH